VTECGYSVYEAYATRQTASAECWDGPSNGLDTIDAVAEGHAEGLLGVLPRVPVITCLVGVLAARMTAARPRDGERCR
jgi:hypothetical protein